MRVLLDASVLIAYLLTPQQQGPAAELVNRALAGEFVVLVARELIDEVKETIVVSRYLRARIPVHQLERLVQSLIAVGEELPSLTTEAPRITRDPEDDYLIAYALAGRADYLVSYDKDLYELQHVETLRVLHPAAFLNILRNSDQV